MKWLVTVVLVGAAAALLLPDRPVLSAAAGRRAGPVLRSPAGWRAVLAAAAVGGVLGAPAGLVGGMLAAAAAGAMTRRWQQARVSARLASRRSAEAELLAALAAELRSGRQAGSALAAAEAVAGPDLAEQLAGARVAAAAGGDVPAALRSVAPDGGTLDRLAAAWQVSIVAGAPLADVVDRVNAELRAVAALTVKADAELAGARATGGLLALLPLLGVGLGQAMGARPLHVLLHTPIGALCAGSGLALELAGLGWVGRLTRAAAGRGP